MKHSQQLITAIKQFEGFSMRAYKPKGEKDTGSRLTIGYGHLGARQGEIISEPQAHRLLVQDVEKIEAELARLSLPHLTQGQWDAIVDFCYNLGTGAFRNSTLYKKILAKAPTSEIIAQFRRWVFSGRTKLPGLVRRREWEAQMWAK